MANSQENSKATTRAEGEASSTSTGQSRSSAELGLVAALVAWALAVITLLDRTPYGLDEATARVVLLLWSMSDQVPAPVLALGVPDFRALFLAPAGVIFSGSLLAVKFGTLLVYLAAIVALYRWRTRDEDAEGPLLASGLLLIAPLAVGQIDHLAVGPFLLLGLALGVWADSLYRSTGARFGGFYFLQLLLCLALPTLHPAGLALPLVLGLAWLRQPEPEAAAPGIIPGRERTHVLVGIGVATLAGVLLAAGWPLQAWFGNPLGALARGILALGAEPGAYATASAPPIDGLLLLAGALLALALAATLWLARARLRADRLGQALLLAGLIGLFCGDGAFALLALVLLLHWGFPLLLRVRLGGAGGFTGQRGMAFAVLLLLCTGFLIADRARYEALQHEPLLSAQDRLIRDVAQRVQQESAAAAAQAAPGLVTPEQKARSGLRVASQWPGRTMIACRCSTLPLPPALDDMARFGANLRGIRFVLFDPLDAANRPLSQDFAMIGGAIAETVALQPGGVVLRLNTEAAQEHAPDMPEPSDSAPGK